MANHSVERVPATLRIGTRTSQLALWQTNHVVRLLQRHWPDLQCELIHRVTQGDKRLDRPLPEIGGKGLFTAELEDALRLGEIDLAVHSLKDLPVEDPADIMIGAVVSREDVRDALIAREGWTLATLPNGAVVGTSSLRRQAQLLAARPDLQVRSIRGNVDTRLRKVLEGEYDAAVMAGAGLLRLGLDEHITQWLEPELMLPAPGQGALAVQCRVNDATVRHLLNAIHDADVARATGAERQLLQRLGGGCSAPIGAWAQVRGERLELRARVATVDGHGVFDVSVAGNDPLQVAQEAADVLLAQGARVALKDTAPSAASVLAGKRVVVTRPTPPDEQHADSLVTQLQSLGAIPVRIPAIQLVPAGDTSELRGAIEQLSHYDWIVFTSANAVERFLAQAADTSTFFRWDGVRIAAVGPATEAALQIHGLSVDVVPTEFLGSAIVGVMGDVAGKHVLLPRSAQGSRDFPDALRAAGASVHEVTTYSPEAVAIEDRARGELAKGVDVVTFTSGSAVRAFADALATDARFANFWSTVVVACIGPTTAEAASALGLPVHVVATEHTLQGLISATVAYFEQESNRKEPEHG